MDVRPAIKGHWPYKKLDDGTDDDTVVAPIATVQKQIEINRVMEGEFDVGHLKF